jgi:arsenite-transporting ATPase
LVGDALDVDLSNGKVTPIISETNLWALEIDVESALEEFKQTAKDFDVTNLSESLGIPSEMIKSLGIEDVASLFTNPPPGIDEIIALTKIFQLSNPNSKAFNGMKFDRIVIDTAPTGHTLRLLQLPAFLNTVTGKLISFRSKIMNTVNSFKSMFGGENPNDTRQPMGGLDRLEELQSNLSNMKKILTNPQQTQFNIVTIPTKLAIEETKRLVNSLQNENIKVSSIICNQVIDEKMGMKYLRTRQMMQRRCIDSLRNKLKILSRDTSDIIDVDAPPRGDKN